MKLRNTLKEDIPQIAQLYNNRKSEKELLWVFANPANNELNSFVAVDEKEKIIGVIGYELSTYCIGDTKIIGSIPVSWMVDKTHKGFAGIQLFKKVIEMGQFFSAVGGSGDAKKIFPAFKLTPAGFLFSYYKVFNPVKYYQSLKKSTINKLGNTLITFPSFLVNKKKNITDVKLLPLNEQFYSENHPEPKAVFHKELTFSYIQWLLKCPYNDGYAFHIIYKDTYLGEAICYRTKVGKTYRGRIVHVPFLGSNIEVWEKVIFSLEKFIISTGCISVNAIAFNPLAKSAFEKMGYYNNVRHKKSLHIKDPRGVLNGINLSDWHLQYTEGDKAYRNI